MVRLPPVVFGGLKVCLAAKSFQRLIDGKPRCFQIDV
jgi:hypothetical protein